MPRRRYWPLCIFLTLAGCQTPPTPIALAGPPDPDPAPVGGIGYIVFDAPITRTSSADLIADMDRYRAQGAREIDLAINSPGGIMSSAEAIVAEMDRLHTASGITFTAYDIRLVASAANRVFLNAQHRYALPRSAFLFHAPSMLDVGSFNAESLRRQADQVDLAAQSFRRVLLARTRLTGAQADVYTTCAVTLSADDALHDGVTTAHSAAPAMEHPS